MKLFTNALLPKLLSGEIQVLIPNNIKKKEV